MQQLNFSKRYFFFTLLFPLILWGSGSVAAASAETILEVPKNFVVEESEEKKHEALKKKVVFLGSENSGKSTLIAALMGEKLKVVQVKTRGLRIIYDSNSQEERPVIKSNENILYTTQKCTPYLAKTGIMLYDTPGMYAVTPVSILLTHQQSYLKDIQQLLVKTAPLKGIVLTFARTDFSAVGVKKNQRIYHQQKFIFQEVVKRFVHWLPDVEAVKQIAPSICMVLQIPFIHGRKRVTMAMLQGIIFHANNVAKRIESAKEKNLTKEHVENLKKQQALLNIFYNTKDKSVQLSNSVNRYTRYLHKQGLKGILLIGLKDLDNALADVDNLNSIAELEEVIENFKGIENPSNVFKDASSYQSPPPSPLADAEEANFGFDNAPPQETRTFGYRPNELTQFLNRLAEEPDSSSESDNQPTGSTLPPPSPASTDNTPFPNLPLGPVQPPPLSARQLTQQRQHRQQPLQQQQQYQQQQPSSPINNPTSSTNNKTEFLAAMRRAIKVLLYSGTVVVVSALAVHGAYYVFVGKKKRIKRFGWHNKIKNKLPNYRNQSVPPLTYI